jgi:hypothetical protein
MMLMLLMLLMMLHEERAEKQTLRRSNPIVSLLP